MIILIYHDENGNKIISKAMNRYITAHILVTGPIAVGEGGGLETTRYEVSEPPGILPCTVWLPGCEFGSWSPMFLPQVLKKDQLTTYNGRAI